MPQDNFASDKNCLFLDSGISRGLNKILPDHMKHWCQGYEVKVENWVAVEVVVAEVVLEVGKVRTALNNNNSPFSRKIEE